ncbi:MAG: SdiA-regulated domain-containing protein, partial [Patescibacteria group bacterium]
SQYVVVGDEGQIATMNADGSVVTMWNLGGLYDLEDVTVADMSSSKVYLLDENTSSAFEFDLTIGALTGKSWSFADKLSEVSGAGAEGLAWANGSFYVGWQYDGDIYVYSATLETSGSQSFVQEIHMTSGYTDISGLAYNSDTQQLYALYDGLNLIEERDLQGTLLASYSVPGSNQEGVTLVTTCSSSTATIVIAEDSGSVMSYSGYPITCSSSTPEPTPTPDPTPVIVDIDADGIEAANDCNDNDATVSVNQTYYLDSDGDTLGSDTTTSVCSVSPPNGYVANSNDTNDSISNYGIEISGDGADNDGDGIVDEVNTLSSNGVHPYYGTLDPKSKTLKISSIISMVGTKNGDILVTYTDKSIYQYDALSLTTKASSNVRSVSGTAYYVVWFGRYSAVVNGYTGAIVSTVTFTKGNIHPLKWVQETLGL